MKIGSFLAPQVTLLWGPMGPNFVKTFVTITKTQFRSFECMVFFLDKFECSSSIKYFFNRVMFNFRPTNFALILPEPEQSIKAIRHDEFYSNTFTCRLTV